MATRLYQFLAGRKTNEGATHLSMASPRGKYMIHGGDLDTFMDLYCTECPDKAFALLESTASLTHLPVLVDADIKREAARDTELTPLYEPVMILRLITIYQKVLRLILDDTLCEEDLLCLAMEKKPYLLENEKTGKVYLKHGFHLHFPKLFLSKIVQEKELIPRVKLEWKKSISHQDSGNLSIDTLIDRSYCRGTPWLMYQSRKSELMDPYLVSYAVDAEGIVTEEWKRCLLDYHLTRSDRTLIDLQWDNLEFHLPRILSVSVFGREQYIREIRENLTPIPSAGIQNQIHQQVNRFHMLAPDANKEQETEIVDRLLGILDFQRSIDRNDWMTVGWTLFNVFRGSEEGFQRWVQFSERSSENFSLEVCRHEWAQMKTKDMTIGTLKYMAKKDNPKAYGEIMHDFMTPFLDKAMKLNGTHSDLAKALFQKYESEFVCGSIKDKVWFQFENHIWNRVDDGFSLRVKISEELVREYEAIGKDLVTKCTNAEEEEQPMYNKRLKNTMQIIGSLKSAPYKNNIMRECTEVFYKPHFIRSLDSNPMLFTFQNGVYDLTQHLFREGRPSDLISIKAPISYRSDFSHDHPDVQMVNDFFDKIFPDRSIRDYFMDISCELFVGGNHAKIVQVWTGEGDNGKSVTQNLFEKLLGAYSIKLPTSLIVGKRTQSSAACPELCRAGNGVRLAMLQEPDKKDVINIGILKELSGNDTFFARGLYKEGSEITPMFKLVLICNDPPQVPYNDRAAWNRIKVIPFESTFNEKAPESPEEQLLQKHFPVDRQFTEKLPRMAEPLAWLLLERLKTLPKHRTEPEKVRLATANYRKKNDIYRQFVDDHVIRDSQSNISIHQSYNIFKEWFREGIPNAPLPSRDDFREYMTKILGEAVRGFWCGVRIQPLQSQDPGLFAPPVATTSGGDRQDPDDEED